MRFASAVAVCLVAATPLPALAADPVGSYSVKGTSPGGGSSYAGTVSVTRTGDTFKVVWKIGNDEFIGTGIGNSEFLTVSYKSGSATGLALYGPDGSGWKGIWTYEGGTKVGVETWAHE